MKARDIMYYASRILSMIALVGGALVTLATGAHATINDTNAPGGETVRIERQPVQEPPVATDDCHPEVLSTEAEQMPAGEIGPEAPKERKSQRRRAASLTDAEREYWSSLDLIEK